MTILFKYIVRSVLSATAMVILVMTSLILIINFLDEMRDIGTGDYGLIQAVFHVFLELPNNIYHFFPMIALLGAVLGLGLLAAHQELVVMRTSGLSTRQITGANVAAAFILILIVTFAGECIAPPAHRLAESHKQSAENGGQAVATVSGVWIHEGNNFLNIQQVIGLKHLEGVTRYEFNDHHQLLAAYFIQSLDLVKKQWILHGGVKTTFVNNTASHSVFNDGTWDLFLNPQLLNVGLAEPSAMTLFELRQYSNHLIKNGLQATEFQFEFWKRVLQPFATLVMILLALPFVMRFSRSVTMGWRVVFAVVVGFIFYMFNAFLGQISIVFQFSPFLAAILPTLLFAFSGLYLSYKWKN
jgi:lipopolysaccharide export system permease protein